MNDLIGIAKVTSWTACAVLILFSLQNYMSSTIFEMQYSMNNFNERRARGNVSLTTERTNNSFGYDITSRKRSENSSANNRNCPQFRKIPKVDDILCMSKLEFDKSYKNPCWRSPVDGALRCLPYFMLIGMDKCGSTDLFDRIVRHPEVVGNKGVLGKESQWWSWKRYGFHYLSDTANRASLGDYIRVYDTAARNIDNSSDANGYHKVITGDGTPMDMWDFGGWPSIPQNTGLKEPRILTPHLVRHLLPDAKLIVILRDPVDRLYSDYFFTENKEKIKNPETFHRAVRKAMAALETCTVKSSFKSCLFNRTLHKQLGNKMTRIHLGFYIVYLREWLKVFPKESFLVLSTDEYSTDITSVMRKVFRFLGLGELSDVDMRRLGIDSAARKHQTATRKRSKPMKESTRNILRNLYRPFNVQLKKTFSLLPEWS